MQDKEYLKYLKSFTETSLDKNRNFPEISPYVNDYDFVEGTLSGYDQKWVARIGKMHLYRELITELKNNPNCAYDICYDRSDLEGVVPAEFSAVLKRPNYWCEVDFDVFGSRVLNCFGIPTVFNRRFEAMDENVGFVRNYVASVSFIKPDEEFFDIYDVNSKHDKKFELKDASKYGLEETLDRIGKIVERFLKANHVNYTKEDIDAYKRYMAMSIAVRVGFLADGDFKNGNTGIILNFARNCFRPTPNFDFGELFDEDTLKDEKRIGLLRDYARLYPEDFLSFSRKVESFVSRKNGRASECEKLANMHIREDNIKKLALNSILKNAGLIKQIEFELVGAKQSGE